MKLFQEREVCEAMNYAKLGGQALHLMSADDWPGPAPAVFRKHRQWAHLLDDDKERLVDTAMRLGVRTIKIGNPGIAGRQHIDLVSHSYGQY
jgi:hypothetical protein